jgi:2-methylcitrate dehydratase PrpD
MTVGLTRSIGAFVEGLAFEHLPPAAVAVATTGFIDCVSCGLAGGAEPVVRIVIDSLPTRAHAGEATLIGDIERASAPDAALANGVACHALDYDDFALFGHPSTVLVPAILAEGEAVGATGPDAICAYVAGYETWADLVGRDRDPHHDKGWHPTGVFGAVAAAAAAAKLRRLDAERVGHAVGLAASMAAGLAANFGSMAKPFHAGRAAQSGVLAARLAAAGMTAAPDALERVPGFLHAVSPRGDVDLDRAPTFGREWAILRYGLNVKRYPVAYCCQRSLDAVFALLAAQPVRPDHVRGVRALMSPTEAGILKHHRPRTGLEAKFSAEFALAAAILAGRVGLGELTDEFVQRPDVQELLGRVRVETTDDADPDMPTFARFERVTVELADGTTIASPEVYRARGSAGAPLTREELWDKFRDCAGARLAEAEARRLFDRLQDLARIGSVAEVLRAAGGPTALSTADSGEEHPELMPDAR